MFETITKYDGRNFVYLSPSQVKQIAGRAGRFKSASLNAEKGESRPKGHVTTLHHDDLAYLQDCMVHETEFIERAGIFPPNNLIAQLSSKFSPSTPLNIVLERSLQSASRSDLYFVCDLSVQSQIGRIVSSIRELSLTEKLTLSTAPVKLRDPIMDKVLRDFARAIVKGRPCTILDFDKIDMKLLERGIPEQKNIANINKVLHQLESLHGTVNLYLWLS